MIIEILTFAIVILLLFTHWVADFVLQSDEMANNKSKSNKHLGLHCLIYGGIFSIVFSPLYGLVNGMLHFCVDYVTSRVNSKLYAKGDIHNFFVSVGFDQFIHITMLILTFIWLL